MSRKSNSSEMNASEILIYYFWQKIIYGMKYWVGVFLAFAFVFSAFGIDKISGSTKRESCAIRISNQLIDQNVPQSGTEFCSGSIIENGSMIAFAAHCLNQVMKVTSDELSDNSFIIGFPDREDSEKIQLQAGQYSLFSGDLLSTVASRDEFIKSGDPKYIKDDMVIIKTKRPISNMTKCPVLPTISECEKFEKNLLSLGKETGLYVDFFISNELLQSGSIIRKVSSWYPSKNLIQVKATNLEFSPSSPGEKNLEAPIKASFAINEKAVRMRKGDSGSLAYWKYNSQDIFVGVLSATISGSPHEGNFSQVCKHVGTRKFDDFVRTFQSPKAQNEQNNRPMSSAQ